MRNIQSGTTLTTLANGAELVAAVAERLLGDVLPAQVGQSTLGREGIYAIAQSAFQNEVTNHMGAIQNVNV
jgi:hypothetical protein